MPDTRTGILIAEDTEDMVMLLEVAFGPSRFDIVGVAGSGEDALEMWEARRAEIGAMALDMRMPGVDGLTVARRVRAQDPDLPIVLFSAELGAELRAEADALGVGVLHKDEILTLPDHPAFH